MNWGHPRPRQGDGVPLHPLLNRDTVSSDVGLLTPEWQRTTSIN